MRIRMLSVVLLLATASTPGRAQQATFKGGTRVVPVVTTVTDANRRLVANLQREEFSILDDGKPVELALFENGVTPFTVVVMLDTSASMTAHLDLLKRSTEQFLIRMLPQDKGQVGAFSDKIQLSGTFTSDRDDLIGALNDLQYGNPTRLWDAVDLSMTELKGTPGRKVVLVFTDGEDTSSKMSAGKILSRAQAEEVMIYAIGLEVDFFNGQRRVRSKPDGSLRRIAAETGGGYFELQKTDDLGPTFSRVAQELHSQYTLGFTPATLDGKEHKLEVRMKQAGHTARARKSYLATPN